MFIHSGKVSKLYSFQGPRRTTNFWHCWNWQQWIVLKNLRYYFIFFIQITFSPNVINSSVMDNIIRPNKNINTENWLLRINQRSSRQKDLSDIAALSLSNYTIYIMWRLHKRLKVQYKWPALIVNRGKRQTKLLSSSACVCEASLVHLNSCFECKWYSWEWVKADMSLRSFCRG